MTVGEVLFEAQAGAVLSAANAAVRGEATKPYVLASYRKAVAAVRERALLSRELNEWRVLTAAQEQLVQLVHTVERRG